MKDHRLKPNVFTFGGIINQLGRAGQCAMVFELLHEMISIKVTPNNIILSGVEQACERCIGDDRIKGRKLLAEQRGGIAPEQLERLSSALEREPRLPVSKFVAKVVPRGHGSTSTKLCQYFNSPTGCYKGVACTFTHGDAGESVSAVTTPHDVAILRNPFRRKLCQFFNTPTGCYKGAACTFSHGDASASASAAPTVPSMTSFTTMGVFAETPRNATLLAPPHHFPKPDEEQVNPILNRFIEEPGPLSVYP
jgi:pentatricopeptide repeat protein